MREGILCRRYSPSRPPSREGRSSARPERAMKADRRARLGAAHSRTLAGAFQGLQPALAPTGGTWHRHGRAPNRVTALRHPQSKDGESAHAPWLPRPVCRRRFVVGRGTGWARAGALWHSRLCGGTARCTPGRWRKRRVTWPRAARRQRLGAVCSRPSGASAGPAPSPRHPRPAPLRSRGVRTEGLRGKQGGREGGRAVVASRPPAGWRRGWDRAEAAGPRRALAGEAARAWTGRGTGERPRGGAREARSLPLPLGRVGLHSAGPGGGSGAAPREARGARRTPGTETCAELCLRPTLLPGPGRLGLWVEFLLLHVGETDHARKRGILRQGNYCP